MFDIPVQRVLTAYVRHHAPHTYRAAVEELREHCGRKLLGIHDAYERRAIGRAYFQAKVALVIRLARLASACG